MNRAGAAKSAKRSARAAAAALSPRAFWGETPTPQGVVGGLIKLSRYTPWLVVVFLFSLIVPPEIQFKIGTLRLSPYRIVLLLAFLPCAVDLVGGRLGRVCLADVALIVHALWVFITMALHHGFQQGLETGGIYTVESFGAYLLARRCVRDVKTFRGTIATLTLIIFVMSVLAAFESFTGRHVIREAARMVFGGPPLGDISTRFGLARAFVTLEHPILYGVVCSSVLAPVILSLPPAAAGYVRWVRGMIICTATFFSLSAGPMAGLASQIYAIIYEALTRRLHVRRRWLVLVGLVVLAYVFVDMASNRPPVHVALYYLTFSRATAYNRLLIWEYGSAEALRHPLIGIGFNDWVRPAWMSRSGSMDNFWLVCAVRYGMLGFISVAVAMLYLLYALVAKQLQGVEARIRAGWVIALFSLFFAGCTVHFWNALFAYFFFFLGLTVWLATDPRKTIVSTQTDVAAVHHRNRLRRLLARRRHKQRLEARGVAGSARLKARAQSRTSSMLRAATRASSRSFRRPHEPD